MGSISTHPRDYLHSTLVGCHARTHPKISNTTPRLFVGKLLQRSPLHLQSKVFQSSARDRYSSKQPCDEMSPMSRENSLTWVTSSPWLRTWETCARDRRSDQVGILSGVNCPRWPDEFFSSARKSEEWQKSGSASPPESKTGILHGDDHTVDLLGRRPRHQVADTSMESPRLVKSDVLSIHSILAAGRQCLCMKAAHESGR